MLGRLDPEESVMYEPEPYSRFLELSQVSELKELFEKFGWEASDEIDIEIGGTAVSGIDVGEVYNKKWQSPIGTRKYNKDAFIIIKNQSRRDLSKSQPMEEFKPQHR
jgi:hypothetical protein